MLRPWAPRALLGLLVLAALLRPGGSQDGSYGVEIVSPAHGSVVSASAAVELRCAFAGLGLGAQHAAAIVVDEEDGGEFPIPEDGEYTFTVPALSEGEHQLTAILLQAGVARARRTVSLHFSSSMPAPAPSNPPAAPAAPPLPPAPAEGPTALDMAPELAIAAPAPCQRLEASDITTILTRTAFPGPTPSSARLTLEINAHEQAIAFGEQGINIAQMPAGLHLLRLRADWLSPSGAPAVLRSGPVWFGVSMDFTVEHTERTAGMHQQPDALAHAALWRCMMAHTHQIVPKLWVALSAAGAYGEALQYTQMAVQQVPQEAWYQVGYACALFLARGGAAEGGGPCAPGSPCAAEVEGAFMRVFELGMDSTTAQGAIKEMVGITDSLSENDEGIALQSALLRAEAAFNRKRFGTAVVRYDAGHACRDDAAPFRCVIIYARQYLEELGDPWGPAKLKTGMGGANEAVIFMARQLRRRGYEVAVYGNPGPEDTGKRDADGIEWQPFWAYDEANRPGAFVVWWHHLDALDMGRRAHARFHWYHYRQYFQRYTPRFVAALSGAFAMSRYHANQMPPYAQPKTIVSANGIDAAMFADGPNAALTMIYASHPFYGLDTLLKAWPRIRARLPAAVLEVYYGWTPGMLRHIERVGAPALEFKARIDSGLQLPGVIAKGMVGQRELTEALSRSGFYLYPCEIAEISSISLMRAQVRAHACARVPV